MSNTINNDLKTFDKINYDELINEFKIENVNSFSNYLSAIWKDLSRRSNEKKKGINRLTFCKYYGLPGIINDRLFSWFDSNKNNYLDLNEFLEGMITLFTDNFEDTAKFIFNYYDFNGDGLITREDVRLVWSYVPIQTKMHTKGKTLYNEDFNDRVEAQDELFILLNKVFDKKEQLNVTEFWHVIYNVNSDIFWYILMFLFEKRPFNSETIAIFDSFIAQAKMACWTPTTYPQNIIMSPSIESKLKSPALKHRFFQMNKSEYKNNNDKWNYKRIYPILDWYSGKVIKEDIKANEHKTSGDSPDKNQTCQKKDLMPLNNLISNTENNSNIHFPHRRDRKILDNLNDVTPTLGPRREINVTSLKDNTVLSDSDSCDESTNINCNVDPGNIIKQTKHEGYMYKITKTHKLKRMWFRLIFKDIYYYKNKNVKMHKGMYNWSGVFLKENEPLTINDKWYYSFAIVYTKQCRNYFIDNKEEYDLWLNKIATWWEVTKITDSYEVQTNWGKGKFGLVKLGVHKNTGVKVAIKIINKEHTTQQDLELVRTEIDIWKIAQHPNIIKLFDVYENQDTIYIIMEYCSGGDLFSYIEKRGFKLQESQAAEIIHKLSAAVFFIHSFGIVHRDWKPENILMTDPSDTADIRLLDFGWSKILGPNETCREPFGTLSYVAPEVLLERQYDNRVDLWSIGIITYLLLSGCLPFDDQHSEKEIARQTIHNSVPFHPILWNNLSSEAKSFVNSLLQKNPNNRLSIKEVLEHEWIKIYYSNVTEKRKKNSNSNISKFKLYASVDE